MTPIDVGVAGIGAWSADAPGWPSMRALLCTEAYATAGASAARRPVPLLLPPAERRRVPDGVAVALEVAREALAGTGIDTGFLASVFASGHGELAIVDYLCATLASDPLLLSPTRFHHSVHNAAAGYWGIATPSVGPSTAIAGGDATFALGLLEAAVQVAADGAPVLLVACDTPGVGLLAEAAPNTALFGAALLLVPQAADASIRLSIALAPHNDATVRDPHPLARSSPAARAIDLLRAIAEGRDATVVHPIANGPTVSVRVLPGPAGSATSRAGSIE